MPDTSSTDRTALRQEQLSTRKAWSTSPEAASAQLALETRLKTVLSQLEPMCLGIYWPMKGEFNPRDLALALAQETGLQLALPFARKQPIEMHYRLWQGQAPDAVDECRIPSTQGKPVVPDVILVPCLAFTPAGYRLGYGGGYFDRFMAQHPGVTAIGVAWQHNQLSDTQLRAQPHDQPLLAVVTEAQIFSQ